MLGELGVLTEPTEKFNMILYGITEHYIYIHTHTRTHNNLIEWKGYSTFTIGFEDKYEIKQFQIIFSSVLFLLLRTSVNFLGKLLPFKKQAIRVPYFWLQTDAVLPIFL